MDTTHNIIIGDSRKMGDIKNESVHLIITSPPYWQLKDYGSKNQIGFNHSYEEYINNLNLVWNECYRVLHKGCRLCINIGDQFARSVYYGRYKVIPIRTEIIKFCETIGFDYMGAIIWQKATTMNTSGGGSVMGSYPNPRNGILKIDYEFILIFKKLGKAPKIDKKIKKQSSMTKEEWNEYFSGHWSFPGERQGKHLAMFPEELPKRLIKMFSFVGETVLDPFLGSGTTSLAAQNLNRCSVGYEINKDFLPIIKKKLKTDEANTSKRYNIIETSMTIDTTREVTKLPYIFSDPIQFDKKVDPKKMTFGSKIDGKEKEKVELYTVKKILSPQKIILNNDLTIRLIGIKTDKAKEKEAIDFLRKKITGRVFLKFDKQKHDKENNLLCYLYLKNKTFINAHLIKNRLVLIDTEQDFKHKKRFITYFNKGS